MELLERWLKNMKIPRLQGKFSSFTDSIKIRNYSLRGRIVLIPFTSTAVSNNHGKHSRPWILTIG